MRGIKTLQLVITAAILCGALGPSTNRITFDNDCMKNRRR
jgi:hypothetical protein